MVKENRELRRISIHALTKSATFSIFNITFCTTISIHALTKSATNNDLMPASPDLVFQSTHSQRVRRPGIGPTRSNFKYFNPRTHKECDLNATHIANIQNDFNPRTHKECDGLAISAKLTSKPFQSTHSQRVRHVNFTSLSKTSLISIHALTKSATRSCIACYQK